MKNSILIVGLVFLSNYVYADKIQVDNLYYELINKANIAKVVSSNNNSYSGDIVIPETIFYDGAEYTVTSIGSNAFSKCSALLSVKIPKSVTELGNYVFFSSKKLKTVELSEKIPSINESCFQNCESLETITIPNSVEIIKDNAFSGCI